MTIGEKIKKNRQEAGLTQKQLGEALGVSQQQIAQYESGKRTPKVDTLVRIARALNTSIVSLFDNTVWNIPTENIGELKKALESDSKSLHEIKENTLILYFKQLNDAGQEKAIENIQLLTKIPEYQVSTATENSHKALE